MIDRRLVLTAILMLSILTFVPISVMAEEVYYDETGGATSNVLREGNTVNEDRLFVGENFTSSSVGVGEFFNRVIVEMLKNNSPDGDVLVGVWNASIAPTEDNYLCLIGSFPASQLTNGAYGLKNVTKSSGDCELVAGGAVGVFYDEPAGSTADMVSIRRDTTNTHDGTNTYAVWYDDVSNAWTASTGSDLNIIIINVDEFSCPDGTFRVLTSTGFICAVLDGETVDLTGVNPLFGSSSRSGIGTLPATFAVLLNIEEEAAELATTIGLILLSLLFIIIPAWRFGVNPPFFVYFIIILMDLALAVVLTWIEPLYFMVAIAVAALGAGLKWSGVL